MKKTLILLLLASAVGLATIALLADGEGERHEAREPAQYGKQDQDDDDERHEHGSGPGTAYLSGPHSASYQAECGECHLTYPPSLLPAASWRAMMGNLEDHFGDNAELDVATAKQITLYLEQYAAGKGRDEHSERSWHATRGRTPPLRITETDYFRGQHHEIPTKMVKGNPEVGSFSRCEACHKGADTGDFDEYGVQIPGYDRWDD